MKRFLKIRLVLLLASIHSICVAQQTGIHFEKGISWDSIKARAKAENKYIFVDCYATWCGPCRTMDQQTYPDAGLGEFMNPLFLSVRVQMDSTKSDNDEVQRWYRTAHDLTTTYHIGVYPTLLFFSPDGELVSRVVGAYKANGLVRIALDARQPENQTYLLLDKFKKGQLADASVPTLIGNLERVEDKKTAEEVAHAYIHNYLLKLPDELLFKEDNIKIIGRYVKSSHDEGFSIFYKYPKEVDLAAGGDGYDKAILWSIILKEDINPRLYKNGDKRQPLTDKPNWNQLQDEIKKKYGAQTAEDVVLYARIKWYKQYKDWPALVNVNMEKIEKSGIDTSNLEDLNNTIFSVFFQYSDDKKILNKAVGWQKIVLDKFPDEPDYVDTYANVLYKLGRKEDAITWETKAVNLTQTQLKKASNDYVNGVTGASGWVNLYKKTLGDENTTLQKMKTGEPTWQTNN